MVRTALPYDIVILGFFFGYNLTFIYVKEKCYCSISQSRTKGVEIRDMRRHTFHSLLGKDVFRQYTKRYEQKLIYAYELFSPRQVLYGMKNDGDVSLLQGTISTSTLPKLRWRNGSVSDELYLVSSFINKPN